MDEFKDRLKQVVEVSEDTIKNNIIISKGGNE